MHVNRKKRKNKKLCIDALKSNNSKIKSVTYDVASEKIESKSIESDQLRKKYHFCRQQIVNNDADKKIERLKRKLRNSLMIGELVYVLAERQRKNDAPQRLYKNTTEINHFSIRTKYL